MLQIFTSFALVLGRHVRVYVIKPRKFTWTWKSGFQYKGQAKENLRMRKCVPFPPLKKGGFGRNFQEYKHS